MKENSVGWPGKLTCSLGQIVRLCAECDRAEQLAVVRLDRGQVAELERGSRVFDVAASFRSRPGMLRAAQAKACGYIACRPSCLRTGSLHETASNKPRPEALDSCTWQFRKPQDVCSGYR